MKKLHKPIRVIAKLFEVVHWAAAALMAVLLIASLAMREAVGALLARGVPAMGGELSTHGFAITAVWADGSVNMTAVALFAAAAVLILAMGAMMCRNVYLIFKTMEGETWFAQGKSPFQKDIVRMVREIGIFMIAIPVVSLLMGVVVTLVFGPDAGVEHSAEVSGIFTGLVVLALSEVFAYGQSLEADVDGLV